ncbi:hypothetical protein GCM10010305_63220 [Streptomyces termitum]|uniref:Uncharacterized protein n=1 Tax=Streptomyces termitum TaxID=67368 RepID=A0A918WBX0_9ACTN|nr:hypothetical protein GCM10010305_63220 [Streptomyces termitum]
MYYPYLTINIVVYILMSRQAWRLCSEALAVMLGGTASSADLGGSSKYSSENLED